MAKKNQNTIENEDKITKNIEINTIESLITAGIDSIVPVTIEYLGEEFAVDIKPLTSNELNLIQSRWLRDKERNMKLDMCVKGMVKEDGSKFTNEELSGLPAGIIDGIAREIEVISGTARENDEQQNEIIRQMLGF